MAELFRHTRKRPLDDEAEPTVADFFSRPITGLDDIVRLIPDDMTLALQRSRIEVDLKTRLLTWYKYILSAGFYETRNTYNIFSNPQTKPAKLDQFAMDLLCVYILYGVLPMTGRRVTTIFIPYLRITDTESNLFIKRKDNTTVVVERLFYLGKIKFFYAAIKALWNESITMFPELRYVTGLLSFGSNKKGRHTIAYRMDTHTKIYEIFDINGTDETCHQDGRLRLVDALRQYGYIPYDEDDMWNAEGMLVLKSVNPKSTCSMVVPLYTLLRETNSAAQMKKMFEIMGSWPYDEIAKPLYAFAETMTLCIARVFWLCASKVSPNIYAGLIAGVRQTKHFEIFDFKEHKNLLDLFLRTTFGCAMPKPTFLAVFTEYCPGTRVVHDLFRDVEVTLPWTA